MLKPFPVLTHLRMKAFDVWKARSLLTGFLGGPTSSLQELHLSGISPPALLSILSSTNDLVDLRLHDLPVTDHVSPQAMVAGLAVMTKLESLTIGFNPYFLASLHPLPALNFSARATLPT